MLLGGVEMTRTGGEQSDVTRAPILRGSEVRRLRERLKLTQGQLAIKAGVDQSHISKIEGGADVDVRLSTALHLARALRVDLIQLLRDAPPAPVSEHFDTFGELRILIADMERQKKMHHRAIDLAQKRMEALEQQLPLRPIPILGRIPASWPLAEEEEHEGMLPVPMELIGNHPAFALRVSGWSMVGAGIAEGDLIIVVADCDQIAEGDIIVADVAGEQTVKRYGGRVDGRVRLVPNGDMDAFWVREDDFRCIGLVVGWFKSARGGVPSPS